MYEIPDTSGLIEKTDCNKEIAEVEFWKKNDGKLWNISNRVISNNLK